MTKEIKEYVIKKITERLETNLRIQEFELEHYNEVNSYTLKAIENDKKLLQKYIDWEVE